jgi:hypothetical protein
MDEYTHMGRYVGTWAHMCVLILHINILIHFHYT